MDFAILVAIFILGLVCGALIGAAWCSDSPRDPMESDVWPG